MPSVYLVFAAFCGIAVNDQPNQPGEQESSSRQELHPVGEMGTMVSPKEGRERGAAPTLGPKVRTGGIGDARS